MTVGPLGASVAPGEGAAAWSWRFADGAGADASAAGVVQVSPAFARRFDAELWFGARWRVFARAGVVSATLLRGGVVAGRPLPLPSPLLSDPADPAD
ncbi:hypothetical protein ACTVCO_10045 [Sanguibacter sp. A247]|uniref:hypothetical protein n=1 Tax=unclassified Sanguibacter TaxID=2645534 RepID=UPI003FD7C06B